MIWRRNTYRKQWKLYEDLLATQTDGAILIYILSLCICGHQSFCLAYQSGRSSGVYIAQTLPSNPPATTSADDSRMRNFLSRGARGRVTLRDIWKVLTIISRD